MVVENESNLCRSLQMRGGKSLHATSKHIEEFKLYACKTHKFNYLMGKTICETFVNNGTQPHNILSEVSHTEKSRWWKQQENMKQTLM